MLETSGFPTIEELENNLGISEAGSNAEQYKRQRTNPKLPKLSIRVGTHKNGTPYYRIRRGKQAFVFEHCCPYTEYQEGCVLIDAALNTWITRSASLKQDAVEAYEIVEVLRMISIYTLPINHLYVLSRCMHASSAWLQFMGTLAHINMMIDTKVIKEAQCRLFEFYFQHYRQFTFTQPTTFSKQEYTSATMLPEKMHDTLDMFVIMPWVYIVPFVQQRTAF